ncbi:hypothetical protein TIFTF001_030640 [Ficus carica]|uniref:Retrovirus-related Pol polyprotein from transposon TNT 1-94-like beta-barrel domain-containing protein n=1 Tax=Ficus carica TaxID=3494 RepID=A0AA88DTH8_FICCA|nr:hypothetical protein TIFTF001_030640 [Ficus carica]
MFGVKYEQIERFDRTSNFSIGLNTMKDVLMRAVYYEKRVIIPNRVYGRMLSALTTMRREILDSRCSFHMCPHKEWFDSYTPYDAGTLLIADDSSAKAIGIGTVKVKMFDTVVRTLANVRHVPRLMRSLIYFGVLDILGCEYFAKSGFMEVRRGALVAMKGEKVKNLSKLIGKTIVCRAMKVGRCQERSSSIAKELARVK